MHFHRLCNIIVALIINYTKSADIINTIEIENNSNLYSNQTRSEQQQQQQQQSANINLQKELEKLNNFPDSKANQPHSRKKRLIWITDDGRLALPPGTSLSISLSISLPFVRHPPEGFLSNLSISFPVSIDFDKLGLTDNQNPLGDLPPIFARSFGKAAGSMLSSYVADYMNYRRIKRDLNNYQSNSNFKATITDDNKMSKKPTLPHQYKHAFHGGERVLLYGIVEDFLETFGVDGKACILRTICEVHSKSLHNFGLFGEITKLFLTASQSPFSDHIQEYVRAEEIGKGNINPGECFPYFKNCPKSIFKTFKNHYSKMDHIDDKNDFNENIIKKNKNENLINEEKTNSKNIVSMKK